MSIVKPLLTIAIPTFNRATILDQALSNILPQIKNYKGQIEFIISDNASKDNTQEVIKKHQEIFLDVNIITNLQLYNTGYFGNFKKCKELSSGEYFWLLSDNEHLSEGVIDFIITTIKANKGYVAVYQLVDLNSLSLKKTENNFKEFKVIQTNFENLVKNESAYLLTLISSVIFLNDKQYDNKVTTELNGNLFLGFIFLCNAIRKNGEITQINGRIFSSIVCNVYFDIFRAWTKDIMECIDYMWNCGLLTKEMKMQFVSGYLQTNLYNSIRSYRINGTLHGKSYGSIDEIRILLDSYYNSYPVYREKIMPLFYPNIIFQTNIVIGKIKRGIIRLICGLVPSLPKNHIFKS